jgi:hypothetical protein
MRCLCPGELLPNQRLEFGVLAKKIENHRANHIDLQLVISRVFERRPGQHVCDSTTPESWRYLGVPKRYPSGTILIELQVRNFAVLFKFESTSRNWLGFPAHVVRFLPFLRREISLYREIPVSSQRCRQIFPVRSLRGCFLKRRHWVGEVKKGSTGKKALRSQYAVLL